MLTSSLACSFHQTCSILAAGAALPSSSRLRFVPVPFSYLLRVNGVFFFALQVGSAACFTQPLRTNKGFFYFAEHSH